MRPALPQIIIVLDDDQRTAHSARREGESQVWEEARMGSKQGPRKSAKVCRSPQGQTMATEGQPDGRSVIYPMHVRRQPGSRESLLP